MNKNDIIVLLKREKERNNNDHYKYLYLNKDITRGGGAFHICEDIQENTFDNNLLWTKEDFSYINLNTALLAFYFESLKNNFNVKIIDSLFTYHLKEYERLNICNEYDINIIKNDISTIKDLWQLVQKWYNEDKIK